MVEASFDVAERIVKLSKENRELNRCLEAVKAQMSHIKEQIQNTRIEASKKDQYPRTVRHELFAEARVLENTLKGLRSAIESDLEE